MTEQNKDATTAQEGMFSNWKNKVNAEVILRVHLDCDDLPDVDYWSMYEEGMLPSEAATEVIRNTVES